MTLLFDDVGPLVSFSIAVGVVSAIIVGLLIFKSLKWSRSKKAVISLSLAFAILILVTWIVLNSFGDT